MASFSYVPKFHHLHWVEFRDLVAADGSNGFNIRFDTIESDLKAVGTVVGQISSSFDQLVPPVPVGTATALLTVTPALLQVGAAAAWSFQLSGAAVAPTTGGPLGVVSLPVPDKVRLTSIRVRGKGTPPANVNTSVVLNQVALADGAPLALAAFAIPKDAAFGAVVPIPASPATVVDLANFRYTVSIGSGPATGDPVTVTSIQLGYTAP
ncbi:hypothetical protein [Actinomadura rupiterrae]|uniref:hypothetical protein n=1 Tax=Actinomadura rupiterrae TaxID=559627 RepID=UPI0020A33FB4|nr:hypothetical protein [Actinomadura rupiterrae]MCP2341333.1 hypothetical protein [Actinomadura rupiterrae]